MKRLERTLPARVLKALIFLFLGAGIYGCASSAEIISTWKNDNITPQNYNRIIVAAMTDNMMVRQNLESELIKQLKAKGIDADPSMAILSAGDIEDPNELLQKMQGKGYGGIMTVAVVEENTDVQYVPGSAAFAPGARFGWYNTFGGYYNYWRPTLYRPGYYERNKVYFLETNLYDTNTERLLWSAQTKSYAPATLETLATNYAKATISKMAEENIIK
jgi:hypothetical protein